MRLPKYLWAFNLALAAAAVLLMVRLYREEPIQLPAPPPPELAERAPLPESAEHEPRPSGEAPSLRNLFGTGAEPPRPEKEEPPPAPEPPSLDLRLVGTLSGPPEIARAVIEDKRARSQNMYRVGDIVQGATIARIDRNRVVLQVGGEEAVLTLHLAEADAAPTVSAARRRRPPAATRTDPRAIQAVGQGRYEVEQEAFLSSGGVAALLNAVELRPHVVDGETAGLLVAQLEEGSLAQLAGIRSGDVLQTVNGQFLNSLPKAFQVMRKARVQNFLDIQVLREGEEKKMSFRMR